MRGALQIAVLATFSTQDTRENPCGNTEKFSLPKNSEGGGPTEKPQFPFEIEFASSTDEREWKAKIMGNSEAVLWPLGLCYMPAFASNLSSQGAGKGLIALSGLALLSELQVETGCTEPRVNKSPFPLPLGSVHSWKL